MAPGRPEPADLNERKKAGLFRISAWVANRRRQKQDSAEAEQNAIVENEAKILQVPIECSIDRTIECSIDRTIECSIGRSGRQLRPRYLHVCLRHVRGHVRVCV